LPRTDAIHLLLACFPGMIKALGVFGPHMQKMQHEVTAKAGRTARLSHLWLRWTVAARNCRRMGYFPGAARALASELSCAGPDYQTHASSRQHRLSTKQLGAYASRPCQLMLLVLAGGDVSGVPDCPHKFCLFLWISRSITWSPAPLGCTVRQPLLRHRPCSNLFCRPYWSRFRS
jgi:hypothetical protein